jgi:hypothetical protein
MTPERLKQIEDEASAMRWRGQVGSAAMISELVNEVRRLQTDMETILACVNSRSGSEPD